MPAATTDDTFNVVILYDKLDSGDRAMALYNQLTHDLADECRPELSLWRFDMAAAPELAAKASRDLASADLILVAAHGRQSCPPAFWGEPHPTGQADEAQRRVLVVFLEMDGEAGPTSGSWIELLRPTVALRPTNVFSWDPPARETTAGKTTAAAAREPELLVAAAGSAASNGWP